MNASLPSFKHHAQMVFTFRSFSRSSHSHVTAATLPRLLAVGDVHLGRILFEVDAPRALVAEDMPKIERRRVEGEVSQAAAGADVLTQRHVGEEQL